MSGATAPVQAMLPHAPSPVDPDARVHLIDALRGFALFGIFLINVGDFALFWAMPAGSRADLPLGGWTRLAELASTTLVRGKFYTMFSFLFGLGFAMLLAGAVRRGVDVGSLYRRRLSVLLIIGALHMTLIWHGDILSVYALMGFLLIPFARVSGRALLTSAGALLLLPVLVRVVVVMSAGALDPGAPVRAARECVAARLLGPVTEGELLRLLQSGDPLLLLKYNLTGPLFRFSELLSTVRFPRVLGVFLIGLWVGRRAILQDAASHRALLWRVFAWGLPLGLAVNGAMAVLARPGRPLDDPMRILDDALAIGAVPLAAAYIAGFTLLWLRPSWQSWLGLLAPAGRMALTNYLAQSVIGIFIFYGVGLGLGGRVGSVVCAAIAIAVFTVQAVASGVWLRYFRYGPVEWLWRSITYRARLPFRRSAPLAPRAVSPT